ncbi:condensation domain-containing protein, partial [Pseudoalteromonas sp. MMG007]|uniref:condensation domain-containing protein n=1 Tax=Pseudoalteromonas sp. MMG007 TaxID=2822684 RepID=UPI001B4FC021
HYNMPSAFRLEGELDQEALQQALDTIVERHESLRTCFTTDDSGDAIQVFREVSSLPLFFSDISGLREIQQQVVIDQANEEEGSLPFDLTRDLMIRARLYKLAEHSHVMLVTLHHIASDGWSMGILVKEFSALYTAYKSGQGNPLPPLSVQYADYAHWQRNWLQDEVLNTQLGYWKEQLADLPTLHSLPLN